MAIACLRLVTLRPDPLFSVPFFRRRIVDATVRDADFPYFAKWPPLISSPEGLRYVSPEGLRYVFTVRPLRFNFRA